MTKVTEMQLPDERPILFKPELVRAILDDRKDVTRRLIMVGRGKERHVLTRGVFHRMEGPIGVFGDDIPDDPVPLRIRCPYAAKRLWVKETWQAWTRGSPEYPLDQDCIEGPIGGDYCDWHSQPEVEFHDPNVETMGHWNPSHGTFTVHMTSTMTRRD